MLSVGATDGSIMLWNVVFQDSDGDDLDEGNDLEPSTENGTVGDAIPISLRFTWHVDIDRVR